LQLAAHPGFPLKEESMNSQTTIQMSGLQKTAPYSSRFACLAEDAIQAHSRLAGETIQCTSGHLWVTLEDDSKDYILMAGESVAIPNTGKVVIEGPGCYQISQNTPELRRAS
jgi:quercetin dioxygenase-like cupin family protein